MDRSLPLHGLRIVDCSRVLAGPFATMLLADLGADVVKLEPPGGDESRGWGPPWWGAPEDRRSAYFGSVNRNKRSIVVDLRTDAGRDLLDRLADGADLLIHNARPSSAARLGLDADRLRAAHPGLVVAVVGGFSGRDRELPAYDLLAQAMSGLMSVTGEPDGPPQKAGVALLDLLAGLEVAVGALAALLGKARGAGTRARRGGEPDGGERGGPGQRAGQPPGDRRGAAAMGECPPEHRAVPVLRDAGWARGHRGRQRRAVRAAARGAGAGRGGALRDERRAGGRARRSWSPGSAPRSSSANATSWSRRCARRTCRPVRWPAWGRRCAAWKRRTTGLGAGGAAHAPRPRPDPARRGEPAASRRPAPAG